MGPYCGWTKSDGETKTFVGNRGILSSRWDSPRCNMGNFATDRILSHPSESIVIGSCYGIASFRFFVLFSPSLFLGARSGFHNPPQYPRQVPPGPFLLGASATFPNFYSHRTTKKSTGPSTELCPPVKPKRKVSHGTCHSHQTQLDL